LSASAGQGSARDVSLEGADQSQFGGPLTPVSPLEASFEDVSETGYQGFPSLATLENSAALKRAGVEISGQRSKGDSLVLTVSGRVRCPTRMLNYALPVLYAPTKYSTCIVCTH
jgi:hypothetical protein